MSAICITDYLNKGGSWKTLFTNASGAILHLEHSKRVLVIDADQQANATTDNGVDVETAELKTLEDLIRGNATLDEVIMRLDCFDLLPAPAHASLGSADLFSRYPAGKEFVFAELFEPLKERYDFIFIDVGTGFNLLTINALVFSDRVVFPVIPNKNAVNGMLQAIEGIQVVQKRLNKGLMVSGIAIGKVPQTYIIGIEKQLKRIMEFSQAFHIPIYQSTIRHSFVIENAETEQGEGINPVLAMPKAEVIHDIRSLVEEIFKGDL